MLTTVPLTFSWPEDFRSMLWLASTLTVDVEVISTPLPLSFSFPLFDWMVTSLAAVIVMVLFLALMTIVFLPLLSMISIFASPSVSDRRMTFPLRDLIARRSFLPSLLYSGGLSLPVHRPPSTHGG